jgi:hypothetical protein
MLGWNSSNDVKAAKQLDVKVGASYSRHTFIVVHSFDSIFPEVVEPTFGPHLPPLKDTGSLAGAWLLRAPRHLALWAAAKREWLSPMFNVSMDPDDPAFAQEEEPLQDAELYLLSKIDYNGSSP